MVKYDTKRKYPTYLPMPINLDNNCTFLIILLGVDVICRNNTIIDRFEGKFLWWRHNESIIIKYYTQKNNNLRFYNKKITNTDININKLLKKLNL